MIGNDVVDLSDPGTQSGATHPRFDERVFAISEIEMLKASGARNRLRWMLWAAKEAAYKVAKKMDPRTIFSPSRFVVSIDETLEGEVTVGDRKLHVRLREEESSVHAIVTSDNDSSIRIIAGTGVLNAEDAWDSEKPGEAARALVIESVSRHLGCDPSHLEVARVGRIPRILDDGRDTGLDVSLSHHGRFVAFACELTDDPRRASP